MKSQNKRRVWMGAGAVTAVLVLGGFGPFRHGGHHMNPEKMQRMAQHRVDDALDDLDATPQQRARIQPLVDATLKDGATLHENHTATRDLFVTEWQKDNPDASALHGAVDQRVDDARAMLHRVVDRVLEVHSILTPKQRSQVSQEVKERLGH